MIKIRQERTTIKRLKIAHVGSQLLDIVNEFRLSKKRMLGYITDIEEAYMYLLKREDLTIEISEDIPTLEDIVKLLPHKSGEYYLEVIDFSKKLLKIHHKYKNKKLDRVTKLAEDINRKGLYYKRTFKNQPLISYYKIHTAEPSIIDREVQGLALTYEVIKYRKSPLGEGVSLDRGKYMVVGLGYPDIYPEGCYHPITEKQYMDIYFTAAIAFNNLYSLNEEL